MDTGKIVIDEETILNNMKNMFTGNWNDILGYYEKVVKCTKSHYDSVCEIAAHCGHLDVLKYAHENGCHWTKWSCARAAIIGHLDILYYLYDNEAPYSTCWGIHPNCKEFFDTYGEYWKNGDFSLMHNLKPAKNK